MFKQTIKAYLDKCAEEDALFAVSYAKTGKNLDDCCTYILNAVQKSGCNGFADEEIHSLALHYWDEDNVEVGKPMNARVVVNHVVELTEEEKSQARKEATRKYQEEAIAKLAKKSAKTNKEDKAVAQPGLFD